MAEAPRRQRPEELWGLKRKRQRARRRRELGGGSAALPRTPRSQTSGLRPGSWYFVSTATNLKPAATLAPARPACASPELTLPHPGACHCTVLVSQG